MHSPHPSSELAQVDHLAQLQHLIPDRLNSEWVQLPCSAHSTRTEPQLVLSLGGRPREAEAGTPAKEALPGTPVRTRSASNPASPLPPIETVREELHGALARHLVSSYAEFLAGKSAAAPASGRDSGDSDSIREDKADIVPPIEHFEAPYPEGVPDVPLAELPPRPDPPSRFATPQRPSGAATPDTALRSALGPTAPRLSTARKPPVHPGSAATGPRARQRRLSFSLAAGEGESALDRLHAALQRDETSVESGAGQSEAPSSPLANRATDGPARGLDAFPSGPLESAVDDEDGFAPGNAILSPEEFDRALQGSQESSSAASASALLGSMPAALRRRSADGIVSLDALRRLSSNEDRQRRLSGAEAVAARDASAVVGALPRLLGRLQRVFGSSGPRALPRVTVLSRLRAGDAGSGLDLDRALEALAGAAPEYLELRPFGSCGTPAVWINRAANTRAVMARLTTMAEQRHATAI